MAFEFCANAAVDIKAPIATAANNFEYMTVLLLVLPGTSNVLVIGEFHLIWTAPPAGRIF